MKEFFARLNPVERRFVVGVAVVFFLVGNFVFVFPHFSEWGATQKAMKQWSDLLVKFQAGADNLPRLRTEIGRYEKEGQTVPSAEQAVQFFNLIASQSTASGVTIINMGSGHDSGTNQFYVERSQTVTAQSGEKQLVDFLYNLGAKKSSLIRVKALSINPDQTHQQLIGRVTLVASYQKPVAASRGAAASGTAAPKPGPAAKTPAPTNAKPAAPAPTPRSALTNRPVPKPGPISPMGRTSATNKPNPLLPKKP